MALVVLPFIGISDPNKQKMLSDAQLFFGIPDTDPEIPANQKVVNATLENGDLVGMPQPVRTNAGGVPQYNGSSVVLDIYGNYSYKVLDSLDNLIYSFPNIVNVDNANNANSGAVIEEQIALTSGQTTVSMASVGTSSAAVFLQSKLGDQGFLAKDIDYTVVDSLTIELAQSYNTGDVLVFRRNDPVGQLIPINEVVVKLLVFDDIPAAQNAAELGALVEGNTFTLNGNAVTGDGLGGIKYIAIPSLFFNDGVNFIDLNGTLQAALESTYNQLKTYSETVAFPLITAGTLNLNLNIGTRHEILMTESAAFITFVNFNPSSSYITRVVLKTTQDGTGSWGIVWNSNVKWSRGVKPSLTEAPGSVDMFSFVTYDGGFTWLGNLMGQDLS